MRRWRLPSLDSKRLRLPSSASGDETRSRDDTNDVLRARGWPLWFCMAGPPAAALAPRLGRKGLVKVFTSRLASKVSAKGRSQIV